MSFANLSAIHYSRWAGLIAVGLYALFASGCSMTSMSQLHELTLPALSQIDMRSPSNRQEQLLVNEISDRIGNFSADSQYKLDYSFDSASVSTLSAAGSSSTLIDHNMTATYSLSAYETGEELTSGSIQVSATSGTITSFYGRGISQQFAEERLSILLGERIFLKLQLYFFSITPVGNTSSVIK
ncbi:hypothetical protein N9U04_01110 [Alphaproteobacteria bacterium]|nr:hypothetical protein [Alphaproteobacteria bacterium]